jgi:uncharacterized protein
MAAEIQLRLYEELSDILPPEKRKLRFSYPLDSILTVQELLICLGVPEKDVELVLINGASSSFSCLLHDGDFVSIYPVFESFDVRPILRVRDQPLRQIRFIVGGRLLPLGHYLHQLGFSALNSQSWTLEKTVCVAEEERRVLLTRNSSLLKSPQFSRIYLVKAARPKDQLVEVLSRFDLFDAVHLSGSQPILTRILKPSAGPL